MKKFFLFAGVFFAACSTDSEYGFENNSPGQIGIAAAIADVSPTRTTITGSTASWASGDVIGLYCAQAVPGGATNVQFTYSGSAWSANPSIYWADAATYHKFVAYAPYAAGNSDYTAVKLPAISTQTGTLAPAQDFLYSNNQWTTGIQRSAGAVPLTFTHALSLVEFDITVTGFASGTTLSNFVLASATSGDKLYTTDGNSTINLSTGAINTAGTTTNTATITPASAPTLSSTAVKLYVLLLPATYTTAPTLTFSLQENSATVTVPATSIVTKTFAAGTKYTYTVSITRTAITISTPTITPWADGGTSSVNPSL